MEITQIKLIENSDFTFRVSFLIDGHNLETREIERITSPEEVDNIIKETANAWLSKRALSNFSVIKKTFEDKTIILK